MATTKRSIVITGGASGIGLGITRHFLAQPDTHVTILDINASTGPKTVEALLAEFPAASLGFEACDVSSWESQEAVFAKVHEERGRIDVVFANAGITEKGKLIPADLSTSTDKPTKPVLTTLDVNLIGVIYTVKLGIHYIAKNSPNASGSKGSVICTASNAGIYPFPIAPIYSTAKHGVIGLVRALARPMQREQIQINALAPAVIQTNIAGDQALFKSMILTPMSTATRAVEQFVTDASLTGKVAELHGEHVTFAEPPAYVDEDTGTNIETFWSLGYA